MYRIGIKKMLIGAMFSALVFIFTFIAIPIGNFGNVNFGDSIILICSLTMGYYGVLPSCIGATLCDVLSGYSIYAPGTFLIKGIMSCFLVFFMKLFKRSKGSMIISMVMVEGIMVLGYLLYELIIFRQGAFLNIPFNIIQGVVNIILSLFIYRIMEKLKIRL